MAVERRRAGERAGKLAEQAAFAAPVAPHGLAVDVVPFRPAGREAADLVAAEPDVPWLRNELHIRQHRVLADRREEGRVLIESRHPAERRGEIEAEAVDVEDLDP